MALVARVARGRAEAAGLVLEGLARDLGIAPFMVRKARGQLSGWTPDGVAQAIAAVARADEQIKGAGADPVYALERAVVAIGAARGD